MFLTGLGTRAGESENIGRMDCIVKSSSYLKIIIYKIVCEEHIVKKLTMSYYEAVSLASKKV